MERLLLDPGVPAPPKPAHLFDRKIIHAAHSLLDDGYVPAPQEGYISSQDVTRQVAEDVWDAMRALARPQ